MNNRITIWFRIVFIMVLARFVWAEAWAMKKSASFEPYFFHQVGDYKIKSAGDKGSLQLSGVGARIGAHYNILYLGVEGQIGLAKMDCDLSPDPIDRNDHPFVKTYDAIGGTLGIVLGRLRLYGTFFFNEKLNYYRNVNASATDAAHDYTYNYFGYGYKLTLVFNPFSGFSFGAGYHRGFFDEYRKQFAPETTNNKNTTFKARTMLKTEMIEVFISWRFGTDKFVTVNSK